MPEAVLEIVELENGDVVLRRSDSSAGSSEPFVTIHFSEEAKSLVNQQTGQLGRFMIGVGLQMVARTQIETMQDDPTEADNDTDDELAAPLNSRLH